jgi:acetyl esterase/lipase
MFLNAIMGIAIGVCVLSVLAPVSVTQIPVINNAVKRVRLTSIIPRTTGWYLTLWTWLVGWVWSELPFHMAFPAVVGYGLGFISAFPLIVSVGFGVIVAWHLWGLHRTRGAIAEAHHNHGIKRHPRPTLMRDLSRALTVFPLWHPTGLKKETKVYFRDGDRPYKIDVYSPLVPPQGHLRPIMLYVHGGAWLRGKRTHVPALVESLVRDGITVCSLDYRLAPRATLLDMLADVKRGIAWVKSECKHYGCDPQKVVISGGSAGGHLASLAALTSKDRSYQAGFEDADCSVMACVSFYGVYNMVAPPSDADGRFGRWVSKMLMRGAAKEDLERISPSHCIKPNTVPPFCVIHGTADNLVPIFTAAEFVGKLRDAKCNVTYLTLPGQHHAFDVTPSMRTLQVQNFVRDWIDHIDQLT